MIAVLLARTQVLENMCQHTDGSVSCVRSRAGFNQLNGSLPAAWQSWSNVTWINLASNNLTGKCSPKNVLRKLL